jgi:hypothetical protein
LTAIADLLPLDSADRLLFDKSLLPDRLFKDGLIVRVRADLDPAWSPDRSRRIRSNDRLNRSAASDR